MFFEDRLLIVSCAHCVCHCIFIYSNTRYTEYTEYIYADVWRRADVNVGRGIPFTSGRKYAIAGVAQHSCATTAVSHWCSTAQTHPYRQRDWSRLGSANDETADSRDDRRARSDRQLCYTQPLTALARSLRDGCKQPTDRTVRKS